MEATPTTSASPIVVDPSVWPQGQSLAMLAYIFAGIGLVIALRVLYLWGRRLWNATWPLRLYKRVGGQLGLGPSDLWWLWSVSRQQKLTTPISLLTNASTLEHHTARYVAAIPGDNAAYVSGRLKTIHRRLFGEPKRSIS
jgi:hypothetical protein